MIKLIQEQKNKMEYLFSYGTLRQQNVQLKNFGRLLDGAEDALKKFILKDIEITDKVVLEVSDKKFHPILSYTGNEKDKVVGTVFKITLDELLKADGYEVDDYKRVEVTLGSGIKSWAYVEKNE